MHLCCGPPRGSKAINTQCFDGGAPQQHECPATVQFSSVRTFMRRGTYVLCRLRTAYLHGARLLRCAPHRRTTANDRPHLAMAYPHTNAHHDRACICTSMACMDRITSSVLLMPHSTMRISDPIHTQPTLSMSRGWKAHTTH